MCAPPVTNRPLRKEEGSGVCKWKLDEKWENATGREHARNTQAAAEHYACGRHIPGGRVTSEF